jgi:NAD(P)-dependent dehydrogenase (short-subunit alcohol dehydrogenase family)
MTGLVRTGFGATSTAAEVVAGVDLTGRRAIVTGASSGIGVETARALAGAGAEVTLAVRNVEAGSRAAAGIAGDVLVAPLDLADQASVAAFVAGWTGPLHVLVNNAGVMATPLLRTAEGWELQFATNHLGHFALATGLSEALAAAGDARVVSVSSVGHVNGGVDFDDLFFDRRPYDPWLAYAQSKTANVLFAVGAAARWAGAGIVVNALNPGRIRSTNLSRYSDRATVPANRRDDQETTGVPATFEANSAASAVSVKDIPQGAATSALLAASPLVAGVTGRYFEDCAEAGPHRPGVRRGVADHALDPVAADRLWQVSLDLIAGRGR